MSTGQAKVEEADAAEELNYTKQAPDLKLEVGPAIGFSMVKAGVADDAGEFYRAFGRKIRLFRSLDKVVVRARDAATATSQVDAAQVAEFGLEETVPSFAMHIFRSRKRLTKQSLNAALNIRGTDPVYINEETGAEMLVTDRFVVRLAAGADLEALDAINHTYGAVIVAPMHSSDREYVCQKPGSSGLEMLVLCETYHQDPSVAWASPDFVFKLRLRYTPTDPLYADQWHLDNTGQSGGTPDADIDAPEAWDRTDTPRGGSPDIVIAIIDTGVDIEHEDLYDNIYENQAEASGSPGVDDDDNGYIDDISGWDFYDNDNDPRPTAEAHGTCCAGVAAAKEGNGLGGVGVAFNCKILPVKIVSDSGTFASSTRIGNGIRYAADIAHVLSNSWSGGVDDSVIHSAIQYAVNTKGRVVLFASGNDADGTNSSPAWIQYTLTGFPGGTYTFKWEYSKDSSISLGDDTVWVDDVTFPGGAFEGFESDFPPAGWTTGGDASWTQYTESKHVLGTGCYSAKAGTITHNQSTYLQTTKSVGSGDLVYYAWTSSEYGYDFFKLYVGGNEYFSRSGVPTVIYDVGYPALYSECIAVGASTSFDLRSAYSEYDETLSHVLDLVAPSNGRSGLTAGITTTDITGSNGYSDGDYMSDFGGTSSATPLTAGVAALILSKDSTLTPAEVRSILQNSADEIGCQSYTDHYNKYYGAGRLNANAALAYNPPSGEVEIIGSWVTGTTHAKEPGDNRAFVVIAHAEGSWWWSPTLSTVTYGEQTMTKITDRVQFVGFRQTRAYVGAFILDEAGVDAATSDTISASWGGLPTSTSLTSVFLEDVNQVALVGAYATNGVTNAGTITTSALATNDGDMVIEGGTCTETGTYTVNNNFTKDIDLGVTDFDGIDGHKPATGAAETPSVTHSTTANRQALLGFVVQAAAAPPGQASNPSPASGAAGVSITADLSWTAGSGATSHDVYFGTTSPGDFQGNQTETTFDPGTMANFTTFYWRIDEKNAGGTTTGIIWSFTTIGVPPTITSTPVTTATVNELYSYDVDANGIPQPSYLLITYPAGMMIDADTGLIQWTPDANQIGDVNVVVEASNVAGSDNQNFTITVLPSDDFDDNKRSAMWRLFAEDYDNAWVSEDANRLNVRATGNVNDLIALYMANGWSFDVNGDFAVEVDFHYSNISEHNGWVGMTIENDDSYVSISAGSDTNESYFYYETAIDGNVVFEQEPRDSNDGTLYIWYDADSNSVYLSHAGYGDVNAYNWQTLPDPLQGRWTSPVDVAIGGGSDGVSLGQGEAYLDNFKIIRAELLGWPPATDIDGDGFIGWGDIRVMSSYWLATGSNIEADVDNDGIVNFVDFAELGLAW